MKGRTTHEIKLDILFCNAVYKWQKTFELRANDRGYKVGDYIKFKPVETRNGIVTMIKHPIQDKTYRITYLLSGWGLKDGYCVFSIERVPEVTTDGDV